MLWKFVSGITLSLNVALMQDVSANCDQHIPLDPYPKFS